jgi:hypothetical protein
MRALQPKTAGAALVPNVEQCGLTDAVSLFTENEFIAARSFRPSPSRRDCSKDHSECRKLSVVIASSFSQTTKTARA